MSLTGTGSTGRGESDGRKTTVTSSLGCSEDTEQCRSEIGHQGLELKRDVCAGQSWCGQESLSPSVRAARDSCCHGHRDAQNPGPVSWSPQASGRHMRRARSLLAGPISVASWALGNHRETGGRSSKADGMRKDTRSGTRSRRLLRVAAGWRRHTSLAGF